MKRIISTAILMILGYAAFSQDSNPNPINQDLSGNFLGTWVWQSRDSSFTLTLINVNLSNGIRLTTGSYLYKVDRKEIVNASFGDGNFWIIGNTPTSDSTKLGIVVVDKITDKPSTAILTLMGNKTIHWKLKEPGAEESGVFYLSRELSF